ncbi:MAG TPA: DUF488 family protein, partial [Ferruginibacter sp.]|nr:DUF488 family protein [Ferruginibacter sp.]
VDRLWPRGVSKEAAALDEWNKNIAPSTELRKWFNHKPELFEEFKSRYLEELKSCRTELERILAIAQHQKLCLLYGAKNQEMNQAVVLKSVLEKMKKG